MLTNDMDLMIHFLSTLTNRSKEYYREKFHSIVADYAKTNEFEDSYIKAIQYFKEYYTFKFIKAIDIRYEKIINYTLQSQKNHHTDINEIESIFDDVLKMHIKNNTWDEHLDTVLSAINYINQMGEQNEEKIN